MKNPSRFARISVDSVMEREGLWYRLSEPEVPEGSLVIVPIRQRVALGYVCEIRSSLPAYARKWNIRSIHSIVAKQWLSHPAQWLLKELKKYYWFPFSLLWVQFLPPGLRVSRTVRLYPKNFPSSLRVRKYISLIPNQGISLSTFRTKAENAGIKCPTIPTLQRWHQKGELQVESHWNFSYPWDFSLPGEISTGRNFTVQIKKYPTQEERIRIEQAIKRGNQVILLLPEWNLLEQFPIPREKVWVLMSAQGQRAQRECWKKAGQGEAGLFVGGHSLIFAPFRRLTEVHILWPEDPRYFHPSAPHIHTAFMATRLAEGWKANLLAYSLAPPIWLLHGYGLSAPSNSLPIIEKISYRAKKKAAGITQLLYERILSHLQKGEKIAFLVRKKGFATLFCYHCQQPVLSPCCEVVLSLRARNEAVCPACERVFPPPSTCLPCGNVRLGLSGLGLKRLKESLTHLFPEFPIFVYSPPQTRSAYSDFLSYRSSAFLIGTPALTDESLPAEIVRVLPLADSFWLSRYPLSYPYESTMEALSTFLRFLQHGRIAYIQSNHPSFFLLEALTAGNVSLVYQQELTFREQLGFPPFRALLEIVLEGKKEVEEASRKLYRFLQKKFSPNDVLSGPHYLGVQGKKTRYRILCKVNQMSQIPQEEIAQKLSEILPSGIFTRIRLLPGGKNDDLSPRSK